MVTTESAFMYGSRFRVIVLVLLLAVFWAPSYGQLNARTVQGVVTDSTGKPIEGAAVLVKNLKTLRVRSYITQADGRYHVSRLRTNEDYEIKAHAQGHWSSSNALSRFDSSP